MGKFKKFIVENDNEWWKDWPERKKALKLRQEKKKSQDNLAKKYFDGLKNDPVYQRDIKITRDLRKKKKISEGRVLINDREVFTGASINRGTMMKLIGSGSQGSVRFLYVKDRWYMWDGNAMLHHLAWKGITSSIGMTKMDQRGPYADLGYPIEILYSKTNKKFYIEASISTRNQTKILDYFRNSREFRKLFSASDTIIFEDEGSTMADLGYN